MTYHLGILLRGRIMAAQRVAQALGELIQWLGLRLPRHFGGEICVFCAYFY